VGDQFEFDVNIYDVPDLETFLKTVLLMPRSVTSDFNFPKWHYFGRGSGKNLSTMSIRSAKCLNLRDLSDSAAITRLVSNPFIGQDYLPQAHDLTKPLHHVCAVLTCLW
jgi:hypothetical protein